jgi:hypothetical protein
MTQPDHFQRRFLTSKRKRTFAAAGVMIALFALQGFPAGQDTTQGKSARPAAAAQSSDTSQRTVSALANRDTSVVPAASQTSDSATKAAHHVLSDTSLKRSPLQKPAIPPQDTASRFLKTPFVSFGIGWALGSYDIFSSWQNTLPDSVGNILPNNPDTLGFSVTEPVNTYNVLFPISVSYTPFVYRRSSVGFEAAFCYIGKTLQATLQHDTLSGKVDYSQTLSSSTFSVGVLYRHALNDRYFRIEGSDRTSFLMGVYALPLSYLYRVTTINSSGIADSIVSPALSAIKDLRAWGFGGAWRVGISTAKGLSQNSGMDVSISYVGRYLGFFRENGRLLQNRDINPFAADPGNTLSSFSNTVEIRLEFIIGTSSPPKKP